ncbi:MAG TPA: MFS transporter, partial [Chloroflexota bacterium]|nr:MFS transporter [Chloroflexota bacterium]
RWTTITALAAVLVGSIDTYIVSTAMPRVLGELGQPELYAWVTAGFVLMQVVGLSVGGAWKDRAGFRLPFVVSVAVFGVGSIACAAAPSMSALVLARAFQGLGGGGMIAVAFAAAAVYPETLRLRMFSLFSTIWGVVAVGAPLLGGLLTDTLGWRSIFLVNVPLCVLVILLGCRGFAASSPRDQRRPLPIARAILLAAAVGGITAAPSVRWPLAFGPLAIGLAAAWLFNREEERAAVRVIPKGSWLGRGAVGSSMHATMFYTAAYTGAGVFLPLYLVEVRHESATLAGIVLTIGGVAWTIGSIIASSRPHGAWPMRLVVSGALLIAGGGLGIALQAAVGGWPLPLVYVAWGMVGLGIGAAMPHLMNWAIVFSPASQAGSVSGAVQIVRYVGSAGGGALMGALLNGIGADPAHLPLSIVAIFLMVFFLGLWPATLGRPHIGERGAREPALASS